MAARNNVYLPHHKHITIWYLKDVLSGKKKRKFNRSVLLMCFQIIDVDGHEVKTLNVPYYEYLTMAKFWDFAKGHPEVFEYMPDEEDRDALPRSWMINVFYTVLKDKFSKWVEDQMERRNKERAKEQNSEVVMHAKFYQAFKESTDVSGI